ILAPALFAAVGRAHADLLHHARSAALEPALLEDLERAALRARLWNQGRAHARRIHEVEHSQAAWREHARHLGQGTRVLPVLEVAEGREQHQHAGEGLPAERQRAEIAAYQAPAQTRIRAREELTRAVEPQPIEPALAQRLEVPPETAAEVEHAPPARAESARDQPLHLGARRGEIAVRVELEVARLESSVIPGLLRAQAVQPRPSPPRS